MRVNEQQINEKEPEKSWLSIFVEQTNEQPDWKKRETKQNAVHPHFLRIFDQKTVDGEKSNSRNRFGTWKFQLSTQEQKRRERQNWKENRKKSEPQKWFAACRNPDF